MHNVKIKVYDESDAIEAVIKDKKIQSRLSHRKVRYEAVRLVEHDSKMWVVAHHSGDKETELLVSFYESPPVVKFRGAGPLSLPRIADKVLYRSTYLIDVTVTQRARGREIKVTKDYGRRGVTLYLDAFEARALIDALEEGLSEL